MAIRAAAQKIKEKKEEKPWWLEKVEAHFMEDNKNYPSPGRFRPSGISECARECLYCYLGVAEYPDHELSTMRYFARGRANQEIWEGIFREIGLRMRTPCSVCYKAGKYVCTHEYPQPWSMTDPNVRGTPDIILVDDTNTEWLVEWKSTWKTRLTREYHLQWQLYSRLTGIRQGWVVTQDPSTWATPPIAMTPNDEFVDKMLDWMRFIEKCVREEVMIAKDDRCGPNKLWKESCDIYEFCHSDKGSNPWR